jgi:SAM-dependent methyltransferase
MGITNVERTWKKCDQCGMYQQDRNYDLKRLEAIYKEGYRHPDFRGKSIREEFDFVNNLPDSENKRRVKWVTDAIGGRPGSLLDIGSGLGVFPWEFRDADVWCVEENLISIDFIHGELGLTCTRDIPDGLFELISVIHVLEHIRDPDSFLKEIKNNMTPASRLFIEVPDASEFSYLPKDNDEFNSCHLHFYTIAHLYHVTDRNDLEIINIDRMHYKDRNLTRILALCRKQR